MGTDVEKFRFPWEPVPVEEQIDHVKRDMAMMIKCTAVQVHSNREALRMLVNTARGQIIPRGVCTFTDGTTVEFQDIGMLQPDTPYMTVEQLVKEIWDVASKLGLEIKQ